MLTKIGALRHVNPAAWRDMVIGAMRKAEGRVPDAALELGVSPRVLFRWLLEPGFEGLERVPHGLPREGRKGRPPKPPPAPKAKARAKKARRKAPAHGKSTFHGES